MKKRNRKQFVKDFLNKATKLDICNYYKYLVDDLKDLFLNNDDKLRDNFKRAKNWEHFIREIEECAREFIYSQEIIGYKNAYDFMVEFDPSLKIGLEETENEDRPLSAL